MIQFFLLFNILSSLSLGEIIASKVTSKNMNVSDPQGASSRGLHITYQYIDQATFTNEGTEKLDQKIQRVDERLTRLIALFILQRIVDTSSVRRGDDYKKQDESSEQVNNRLTKAVGLSQNIAGSSSSMKNDDVIRNSSQTLYKTRLGCHGFRTKVYITSNSGLISGLRLGNLRFQSNTPFFLLKTELSFF